jgi:HD-like signal output (HDOD) protein
MVTPVATSTEGLPVRFAASTQSAIVIAIDADLAAGELELPILPGVAAEVLSVSLDDNSAVGRLAKLIQQDQSLALHLLKVVNSPAYRGANEIVALQQAITRLGMNHIRQIAIAVALGDAVATPSDFQNIADDCWRLALGTGLWCKELARAGRKNVEVAYLCGLLHNIGAPLVLQRLDEHRDLANGQLDSTAVLSVLECSEVHAGCLLAAHWALPQSVQEVIAALGNFSAAQAQVEADSEAVLDLVALALTETARTIAHCQIQGGMTITGCERLVEKLAVTPELQYLNLYPADVATVLEAAEDIHTATEAML